MNDAAPLSAAAALATRIGKYRWRVCAMLLAATTINYVDRQVLGVLAPFLQDEIGWNEIEYGYIVTAFQAAYAIGLLCAGAVIDRLGTRIGYAIAIGVWSLAAMGHALAASVLGFAFARFMLGLGEAGNFPAAIKTVAEWFPRRERALAVGIFNAGSNIGAVLAPLLVPIVAAAWGWQAAFLCTGVLSVAWLVTWLLTYRTPEEQPKLSPAELAHIRSDPPEPTARLPWRRLLRHRQAWAFVAAKFITDPVWWLFLFWLGKFLASEYELSLAKIGPPMIVVYLMADVGSVAGGWLAGRLLKRGWNVNRARKGAMLACALCVAPVALVTQIDNLWLAVALIGLAMAGHQGWSANVFTLPSDMFPRHAVASVVGIGGFAGAVGGMAMSLFTGAQLESTGSYARVFLIAGIAYLLALLVVHLLVPRLQPARLEEKPHDV
ncbi:MFS transporter [Vulcaniibacterium tengchongense]|uniref:ACS family hexuronate transporter-like MFS transporter n=1 Tax=Vulcaniibacterium tengchongense TaxID=1273429 RepID=A0A3N4VHR5_9GAMM|nr:MFS transporter [Vulcaniibacterium tengchongense]RPE81223.1 ACS family hexuronate transporter-like MFS transporter [Vulcaniibacterium tengchongense]